MCRASENSPHHLDPPARLLRQRRGDGEGRAHQAPIPVRHGLVGHAGLGGGRVRGGPVLDPGRSAQPGARAGRRVDGGRARDAYATELCPGQPDHVWQQNHSDVFYSSDGAATWTKVSAPVRGVHFGFPIAVDESDGKTAWVVPGKSDQGRMAIDGGLFVARTEDGGKTQEPRRRGLPQEHAYDVVLRHALGISGSRLAFGSTTGNLYVSEDRGDSLDRRSEQPAADLRGALRLTGLAQHVHCPMVVRSSAGRAVRARRTRCADGDWRARAEMTAGPDPARGIKPHRPRSRPSAKEGSSGAQTRVPAPGRRGRVRRRGNRPERRPLAPAAGAAWDRTTAR